MDRDIENEFRRFRAGDVALAQLRLWLDNERTRVESQIPRGQLLKLKRGSDAQVIAAVARLIPACPHCLGVGEPKQFVSRTEYEQYSRRRDAAVANGGLQEISPPHFPTEDEGAAGAAMYYRCLQCESFWCFVEPERADNGAWKRIF